MHCGRLIATKSKGISIKFTPGRVTRTLAPNFETLKLRNHHFECWNEMLNTLNALLQKKQDGMTTVESEENKWLRNNTSSCELHYRSPALVICFFCSSWAATKKNSDRKHVVLLHVPGIMPRCKSPWHPETSSDKWSQHPDIIQITPPSCWPAAGESVWSPGMCWWQPGSRSWQPRRPIISPAACHATVKSAANENMTKRSLKLHIWASVGHFHGSPSQLG